MSMPQFVAQLVPQLAHVASCEWWKGVFTWTHHHPSTTHNSPRGRVVAGTNCSTSYDTNITHIKQEEKPTQKIIKTLIIPKRSIIYHSIKPKWANALFAQKFQVFTPFPKLIREMPLFCNSIFSKSSFNAKLDLQKIEYEVIKLKNKK